MMRLCECCAVNSKLSCASQAICSQAVNSSLCALTYFSEHSGCGWQVHDGVRYLPAATRDARLAALQRERGGADAGFNRGRCDIPLTKPDDRAFTERLSESVNTWLQVGSCFQSELHYGVTLLS